MVVSVGGYYLGMSQPPLSEQIQVLEQALEVTLFERSRRGEAGNIDLAFARLDGDLGPTVQSLPLREDRLMVALPSHHALAACTRTSLSSLASALYSASLRHKVRAGAVRGIFQSMVELSDNADLMGKFLGCPARSCSCTASRTLGCPTCRTSRPTACGWRRLSSAGASRCIPTLARCGSKSLTFSGLESPHQAI
ncbi:LysR family transcriptional regulator [Pseudomonas canadensis]|uniref:LysR family transcriptional regulator n=1 Tax=Pseudomonas canadensis TaxID=915099 RepID=UPI001F2A6F4C|nr:LysR family transcriptional regulator [Pseudomonas canadensis]